MQVEVRETLNTTQYLYICPDQAIIFPSATFIRAVISKAGERAGQSKLPVVVDCLHINNTDFTAAKGFKAMLSDFKSREQEVYWLNTSPDIHHVLYSVAGAAYKTISTTEDLARGEPDSSIQTYQNQDAALQV